MTNVLPFDILTLIPSHFLSMCDVLSFSLVCKSWHDALLCSEINIPVTISKKNKSYCCNLNLNVHCIL